MPDVWFLLNLLIAVSYFELSALTILIPFFLRLDNRIVKIQFYGFACFILSCGIGHFLEAVSSQYCLFWHGVTATASISEAVLLTSTLVLKSADMRRFVAAERLNALIANSEDLRPFVLLESVESDLVCLQTNSRDKGSTLLQPGELLGQKMAAHHEVVPALGRSLINLYLDLAENGGFFEGDIPYIDQTNEIAGVFSVSARQVCPRTIFVTWKEADAAADLAAIQGIIDIQRAMLSDVLELWYQPIYRLSDMKLVGAEALIRWPHSDGSVSMPDQFLPALELAGLAPDLFFYTLRAACRALRKFPEHLWVSVNLSLSAIDDKGVFIKRLRDESQNIGRDRLKFEITEEEALSLAFVEPLEMVADRYDVGLDDFGEKKAGFGQLIALAVRRIITNLKIDRSIVSGICVDVERQLAVKAIVALSNGLNFLTTAEGLESIEEIEMARILGVTYGQGFGLGEPQRLLTDEDYYEFEKNNLITF